jgi:hypothetical protein
MDNPETFETLGPQDTGQRHAKHKYTAQHRKLKWWATRTLPNTGVNQGAPEG